MESKIAILHRSEIVRKGLAKMIGAIWKNDLLLSHNASGFFSREYCRRCRLLVFAEALIAEEITNAIRETENELVLVFDNPGEIMPQYRHLRAVDLYVEFQVIQDIVNGFLLREPGSESGENDLTLREKEVLTLVAMGFSNKEIADNLFISIHTVITHRKNITAKLGIKSISGLTVYAIINRLIDPDRIDPEKLI
jgi:DNA-binding CsgD family transcriptional regulator